MVGYDPHNPDPVERLFLQPYFDAVDRVVARGGLLAHYTSAPVLFSILEKREVWMRNARLMNDFSELQHGATLIDRAMKMKAFDGIREITNAQFHDAFDEAFGLNAHSLDDVQRNCWIACLSEHFGADQKMGKLSMWRAYAQSNGVAILIDPKALVQPSDAIGAYSYPVSYEDEDAYCARIQNISDCLRRDGQLLSRSNRDCVIWLIWSLIRQSVFCLKHPGFIEEAEWRMVYLPNQRSEDGSAAPVPPTPSIEVVNGLPQTVYKVGLQNSPAHNLYNIEPDQLVQRVIIGPSSNAEFLAGEVVAALERAEISNPNSRVIISGIPLRT